MNHYSAYAIVVIVLLLGAVIYQNRYIFNKYPDDERLKELKATPFVLGLIAVLIILSQL